MLQMLHSADGLLQLEISYERLRLRQLGKEPALPNFLSPVLVRKNFGG